MHHVEHSSHVAVAKFDIIMSISQLNQTTALLSKAVHESRQVRMVHKP